MMYAFDKYTLDTNRYELRRSGQRIGLEPLVFNVLAYLVIHHDRVIPRHELLEQLWNNTVVDDGSLRRCIRMARRVLSDAYHAPRFIETVYCRGYRFIAPVVPLDCTYGSATSLVATGLTREVAPQPSPVCQQA